MFLKFPWYPVKFYIASWLFLHIGPFSYPLYRNQLQAIRTQEGYKFVKHTSPYPYLQIEN